ncbi:hypothetical protein DFP72DRAFT_871616, partial [Ephemerocybe angulata]
MVMAVVVVVVVLEQEGLLLRCQAGPNPADRRQRALESGQHRLGPWPLSYSFLHSVYLMCIYFSPLILGPWYQYSVSCLPSILILTCLLNPFRRSSECLF